MGQAAMCKLRDGHPGLKKIFKNLVARQIFWSPSIQYKGLQHLENLEHWDSMPSQKKIIHMPLFWAVAHTSG